MRVRTGYSFRTAIGDVDEAVARIVELKWPAAPIADRASTFGWVSWDKACKKAGIRPVFGVELAVTESIHAKKPVVDYWTFWAIDDIADVNRLVTIATSQFRYEPLLTYEQALEAKGVFKMVGYRARLDLIPAKAAKANTVAVGWAPSAGLGYLRAAAKRGLRPIETSDNRYLKAGDERLYEIVAGRNASRQTYPQTLLSDKEWAAAVIPVDGWDARAAIETRNGWLKKCKAELRKAELYIPEKKETLKAMCERGAKKLGVNLKDKVYKARMDRELKLIADKKFEDYFYIIADVVQWARGRMLVGPARGSSCGSLVCYLLEITTVDPIPFGLIFERFIDINRSDLPDIDIDFSDTRRHLVFEYMETKYGTEHIARLGAVAKYQPRSSLSEAGAALDVPRFLTDKVLQGLIERSSGDSRALSTLEDTLKETPNGRELLAKHPEILIAGDMEGMPHHYTQHAAGIILTQRPVSDYVAVDAQKGSAHCDKKDAEDLGLLKIDALGLKQLSIIEDVLEMIGKPYSWLDKLPLDDQKAFDILNEGKWSGIFQYTGPALMSITKTIHVGHINDIINITALARPGPMATGGANRWALRHEGKQAVDYPHPIFKPFLEDTLGIVVYQEQVMEIGRQIGDLNWEQVTALRKAMSKSLGKEFFDQYGDPFKKGAIAKGVPKKDADKIWDDLCAYGSWAFNKSHSVAYGLLSYQTLYLKAHYPLQFAAATLSHEDDADKMLRMLRELHAEGINYVPVDADNSIDKWSVANGKLIGPLSNVKGIGPKMMDHILSSRKQKKPLSNRAQKLLNDAKTKLDSLWPIADRIKVIMPDPLARNIRTPFTDLKLVQPVLEYDDKGQKVDREYCVIGVVDRIAPRDSNDAQKVATRGYEVRPARDGNTMNLNITLRDDTDDILCIVSRWKYNEIAQPVIDRGKPGKAIYAIKGKCPADFRMIWVDSVKYIGDME